MRSNELALKVWTLAKSGREEGSGGLGSRVTRFSQGWSAYTRSWPEAETSPPVHDQSHSQSPADLRSEIMETTHYSRESPLFVCREQQQTQNLISNQSRTPHAFDHRPFGKLQSASQTSSRWTNQHDEKKGGEIRSASMQCFFGGVCGMSRLRG